MIDRLPESAKTALKATIVGSGLLFIGSAASAQQSMTIEELEDFILKKKSELTESIEQRDATLDEREALEKKLAEQAEREKSIKDELRSLCDEREAAEPGSRDACLAELDIASK